jgi:hypothetical protein
MSRRHWVKQYGLQRSGTNYARALMESISPDARVLAAMLGNKHDLPDLDNAVARLREGDIGLAETDLTEDDFSEIVQSYESGDLRILVCVRDVVMWMDSWERYRAKRERRDVQNLSRIDIEPLVRRWIDYYTQLHDWCADSSIATSWVVHHQLVRKPEILVDVARSWGIPCADEVPRIGYMRNGSDKHSSRFISRQKYRSDQYAEVHAGAGLIALEDVSWTQELVKTLDTRGLSRNWMWRGASLRRRTRREEVAQDKND